MNILATAAAVIGTTVSAVGQVRAGQAAEAIGDYHKEQSKVNAKNKQLEGAARYSREASLNRRRLAAIRSRMAGRGVTLQGSSLDMISESARRLETRAQDAYRINLIQGMHETQRGNVAQWEGQQARKASGYKAAGTLLQGVSSAAGQIYSYQTG